MFVPYNPISCDTFLSMKTFSLVINSFNSLTKSTLNSNVPSVNLTNLGIPSI